MNCITSLVLTVVHAGHRHAVIVVKEARAQVYELKSYVFRLLLVSNNGYGIYGINNGYCDDCLFSFQLL